MVGQDSFGPGPRQWLPGSSLWSLHRDPIAYMARLQERYGDLVHWRIGPQDVVMVARSDLARDVLVTHHRSFKKGPGFERAQIVLGQGLLTSEGDFHLRHRRMIQPAFHRRSVAAYGEVMVTEAARLRDGWEAGGTVDVADEMTRVTLAIVSRALFGHSVEHEAGTIGEAITRVGGFFDYLVIALLPLLLRLPLPAVRRFKRGCAELDAATLRVVASRRGGTGATDGDGDLLSILLAARDVEGDQAGLTDAEVRDEVVTLITAGHETTANALNWLWYLLAQHPEAERRMHEEIDTVLRGRLPTADDMERLRYVEMVLLEAMRLYPPAWGIERRALRDQEIGGCTIPAGAVVLMPTILMNRDERFFPAPLRFDPDRFAPEAAAGRPRHAFLLFGGGPRQCIGNAFALLEGVLIVSVLAQRWQLRLAPGQVVTPQATVTLRPKGGLPMTVERRRS
jgi:cytochrome P450